MEGNVSTRKQSTGQLAESLPGAVSIFARAYQRQTGGTQTGSDAIKTLLAAMKKGQVRGDILTYAGDIAAETAAPGVERASQTSQGQQARFENSLNDTAIIASAAGVEEAFARIFKTLSEVVDESQGFTEDLAAGFNKVTQAASYLLLIPQDFKRLMEGQDSVIADWLWGKGQSGTETLANMLEIRDVFKNIKDLGELSYQGWKMLFDLMSQNEGLQFFGKPLATLNKGFKAVLDAGSGNTDSAVENAKDFGTGYLDYITTPGRKFLSLFTSADEDPNAQQSSLSGMLNNFATNGFGSNGWFGSRDTLGEAANTITGNQLNKAYDVPNFSTDLNPLGDWQAQNSMAAQAIASQGIANILSYKPMVIPQTPPTPTTDQFGATANSAVNNSVSNVFNMNINFDATLGTNGQVDFQQGARDFGEWFKNEIGTAAVNFPNNQ